MPPKPLRELMTISAATIPVIDSLHPVGRNYAAWLVDIWGVMHNGVRAFPSAVETKFRFRGEGGIVVLVSNSPRPRPPLTHPHQSTCVDGDELYALFFSGASYIHRLS